MAVVDAHAASTVHLIVRNPYVQFLEADAASKRESVQKAWRGNLQTWLTPSGARLREASTGAREAPQWHNRDQQYE